MLPFFAVDLQHFVFFASGGKAGGFEGADGPVGKGDGGDKGVIDGNFAAAAAVGKRPFHSARQCQPIVVRPVAGTSCAESFCRRWCVPCP